MGARFNVPISVLWPATDGNDFPLQTDYFALYDRYIDSVRQVMPTCTRINTKRKFASSPSRSSPLLHHDGHDGAGAVCRQRGKRPNFGLNIDVGHSLIARETLKTSFAWWAATRNLSHALNDNDQQCDADVPPGTVKLYPPGQLCFSCSTDGL